MPCTDGGVPYLDYDEPNYEAILCGVFTFLENQPVPVIRDVLENLDYKEMGVSKTVVRDWWAKHKRIDEERRQRKEEAKRLRQVAKQALGKLTDEEKDALGLGD